jgi:UDP-N-acetylglucosamine:LPS N-acetylglucosamine transferase
MSEAQLVSINMGYGHQRTAFALRQLAFEKKIINANDYPGIPTIDKEIWESTRRFYEFISAFKKFPLFGNLTFAIFDAFQKILSFYPRRDLSKPNFTLKNNYSLLKKGWGRDLILRLGSGQVEKPLPLISTFFTPAFMAEFFNYPGEIFCVICDADISRTWASLEPKKSRIKYFAPTERVVERLKLYGVNSENISLTGYPLPLEIIGSEKLEVLKEDFKKRIINLDPQGKYREKYRILIRENLGELPEKPDHLLTVMFAVGGGGAQKEIGIKILKSLKEKINKRQVKIILVAGIRKKVKDYFMENIKILKLEERVNSEIELLFKEDINNYFQAFNEALRKTDILWTKPSELSFYTALGLPIIISPTIGSQEEFNKRWLLKSGFGVLQENPDYTNQWLFDWLEKGYLAKAAMQGFIEGEKLGTINIRKICFGY